MREGKNAYNLYDWNMHDKLCVLAFRSELDNEKKEKNLYVLLFELR